MRLQRGKEYRKLMKKIIKVDDLQARLTKPHREQTQISDRRMKQGITGSPTAIET